MTDREKKNIINKTLIVVREILSNSNCIGFDVNGEPYIDQKVVTKQIRRELEDRL